MSKVQSPTSNVQQHASRDEASDSQAHAGTADVRHWTLDAGLTVTDLRKSFLSASGERIEVLRGASFSASAGETLAIMGASGAGKSTLLHLLGGLEAADHGSILAGKFAVDRATPSALAHFRNQSVGFVFQFHHLLPDLTTLENVGLPLMITRATFGDAMRRAARMLEEVHLGDRVSQLVAHLSGGEQQRVAVCRALITRPALVLADEPTGNLEAAMGDEIGRSLMSYARDNGALVIIATHNRALAALCDRVLVLRAGRLTEE
ncbi:MAG TPA: lipoprotein-releasing system ATP-binding protein LolD [Blastocatellia bacterium]|nr:lipoprotein-releasing system ATP-binding protein LolD [Blastocatellia bacterium]HAF24322.1 lipoprotein-releasing system ATP-binding protein LolD [Blastocatellia bacterium]HCX30243.1 lipoprotein-releasing system ATP-binding protein LolD [Blastocatellia bacterium]